MDRRRIRMAAITESRLLALPAAVLDFPPWNHSGTEASGEDRQLKEDHSPNTSFLRQIDA